MLVPRNLTMLVVLASPALSQDLPAAGDLEPAVEVQRDAAGSDLTTVFRVKYVAEGVAYLDGGRSAGLAEGMKLEVAEGGMIVQQGASLDPGDPRVVAELEVTAVAETSGVATLGSHSRKPLVGDVAYLSTGDARALLESRSLSATRHYPAVVTFTEGDPLDEEVREEVPRPPLPSVNRARGRIGLDYVATVAHGDSDVRSSTFGLVLRPDITRLAGSYWNVSGYWRGRSGASSAGGTETVRDLMDRTYHLSATYENPGSRWVAGFGRLHLPWASSLDTIDGGYLGRRLGSAATVGVFGGSTPDPTSFTYAADRRIAGAFVNFEGGSFDAFRYTSTSGVGADAMGWKVDRPFLFVENGLFYKRYLSIYESLQLDLSSGGAGETDRAGGISRSFLTVRVEPTSRVELTLNHTYFRDLPEFDPQLVGTGLLDEYLFQGANLGARVELVDSVWLYATLGRSNRTGDTGSSLNQTYGAAGKLPWLGLRVDGHFARFNSSLGQGSYWSFSLSRSFGDDVRLEVLAGQQSFSTSFTGPEEARFVTSNVDVSLGSHYFLQGGVTLSRGQFSYDQWMLTVGYVFDSKARRP